jgi:ribonuclease BN (tRNA processing enzyme)
MRVTILGAGTAIPANGHSPAGIYVQAGRERLLLDAGPGTLQRLHAAGGSFLHLDRIFFTHFHIDHCLDLATTLFALRIPQPSRKKPLSIYGPRGLKTLYRRLNFAFEGWLEPPVYRAGQLAAFPGEGPTRGKSEPMYRLTIQELGERTVRLNGYTVTTRRMDHYQTGAIGYRLQSGGKVLVYSGDTDTCQAIVELGEGADLLILECSMPDERKAGGHLTPSECGQIAAAAGCKHLVLTHFYPVFHGYDIRRRVRHFYRGRLTLGRDLLRVPI